MTDNRVNHITGRPDYINKELKKVSKEDLLFTLKQLNEKNEKARWEMMRDTAQALHGNKLVCLPKLLNP